ncbi:uncharacterized protein LOC131227914 [Magnolia sinica]|uniref:uncharacterized protein LOC131227914 n=1 Tax=Magnolia sinica TaxID=86752 RepID=UPI00265B2638|nr:uncharacterized protein LOC131227914 [Magnolia sinica]
MTSPSLFREGYLSGARTNNIINDWKTKDEKLILYHVYLDNLIDKFRKVTFTYMPRAMNQFADALDTLASILDISKGAAQWELIVKLQNDSTFYLQIEEAETPLDKHPWYTDIRKYLEDWVYPESAMPTDRRTIQ